jgi:hypothetical protein
MVDVYHRLATAIHRTITWLHMPVPRNRDDDPYFSPLRNLKLKSGTELYLGLIHLTDGIEGAKRRAAAAKRFCVEFRSRDRMRLWTTATRDHSGLDPATSRGGTASIATPIGEPEEIQK